MEGYHKSVLLNEVMEALDIRDAWYLDATLGDGGHSIEIIKRGGKVVGFDVDPQAFVRVNGRFEQLGISKDKYKLTQGNFRDAKNLIKTGTKLAGVKLNLAGAIFDLGVSSLQLETPERGFSFMHEGPLDMRMDPDLQVRAFDLVNALNKGELYELFNKLGEENNSRTLAETLVFARQVKPIKTTRDLAEIVERRIGRRGKIHPATLVFQALRIAVNDELNAIKGGLSQVRELIEENGRIVVISFHSLEDRIIKNIFRQWETQGLGRVLTKRPIMVSEGELLKNSRARSAKMRVFEVSL